MNELAAAHGRPPAVAAPAGAPWGAVPAQRHPPPVGLHGRAPPRGGAAEYARAPTGDATGPEPDGAHHGGRARPGALPERLPRRARRPAGPHARRAGLRARLTPAGPGRGADPPFPPSP